MKIKNIVVGLIVMIVLSMGVYAEYNSYDYATIGITLLNQDPDPANQGEYLDIRFKVIKKGNEVLEDLTFLLDAKYPFSFDGADNPEKEIGNWYGYPNSDDEYYTLHYKVRAADDALEDIYKLKLKYQHSKSNGWVFNEYDIRVGDKNESEFVFGTLTTSPTKLIADYDEAQLDVELENIGDGDAQNVKLEIELPEGFEPTYSYSDRANIGTLAADSSETATFYVDTAEGLKAGIYEAKLNLEYKEASDDDNEIKYAVMPLKIPISGMPVFSVESVKTIPEKIKEGTNVQLLITVKNVGSKEAEAVSLRAYKESSQPFEFDEKSDFVGKLKPGETGEAVLKFSVDKSATVKTHILDLEIRGVYNDEVITDDAIATIRVENGEKKGLFGSGASLIIGLVIVLVVVGVGLLIYFKRKRE